MRAPLVTLAVCLALAGCDSGPDSDGDGTVSMSEAREEIERSDIRPEPGLYRVSVEVMEVDVPGAPPQAIDMIRNMMGGQSHEYCLTPEDAAKGYEETVRQSQDGACGFERFELADDEIDAQMVCDAPGRGKSTTTVTGKVTPTSSQLEMAMEGTVEGMGEATFRMRSTQERTGDCAA